MKLDPSDLDGAVAWTLYRAARSVEWKMNETIAGQGLSAVQFGVLAQLATHESMTRAELARACYTRPQSMAGVIEGMLEKDLLRLAGTGGRGRPNPVSLTAKGAAIIEKAWPAFAGGEQAQLGLSAAEAATLNATLHRLLDD